MRKINFESLKTAVGALTHRFPAAITFLLLLTLWGILGLWNIVWPKMSDLHFGILCYYLSIATILSIVLKLWGEEVKNHRTILITTIVAHLALIADAVYLWTQFEGSINAELVIAQGAFCTALLLAGIFLPYFREKDDLPAWNFSVRMAFFAFVCSWVCGTVASCLYMLLQSLDWLFGIGLNSHWKESVFFVLCLTVSVCLWMSRLPEGEKKFNRKAFTSKFLTGLVKYLATPLLICYIVVLYFYGAKILFTMELPKGGVCQLICVLMGVFLAVEFLLYPLHCKAKAEDEVNSRFEQGVVRWLPIVILPLLVLMSVAIGRRIADYGITESRLYMLTLNLWFYGVCIGLYLTRSRRINWVALSFAALFLLTSVFPVNFCSLSRHAIQSHTESIPSLPQDYHFYKGEVYEVPEGYQRFREVYISERLEAKDSLAWNFDCQDSLHFTIDLKNLPVTGDPNHLWLIPEQDHHVVLEVTQLDYSRNYYDTLVMDIDLRGYLFE